MGTNRSLLDALHGMGAQFDAVVQWGFFKLIFDFLDTEVAVFRDNLLGETVGWAASMALVLTTIWILYNGWMVISGRSRESMMGLVVQSLRVVLIVTAATTMAFGSTRLYVTLTDGLPKEINQLVTGSDKAPEDSIDENVKLMTAAFAGIDALAVIQDPNNKTDKDRAFWMTGIGIAGPSVIAGAMLLLYKIALALFVGLGPLFILSLLFESTKSLFQRWLLYGLGTMFSLGVLAFMVSVSTKLVGAVAAAAVAQYLLALSPTISGLAGSPGINSAALQQGGLGLVMSVLMVSAPPMAAMFFNGTLGQFVANSSFGNVGRNSTGQVSDYKQDITRTDGRGPRNDDEFKKGQRPEGLKPR